MSSVIHIRPKSNVVEYNGYTITTTFDKDTGKWKAHAVRPVTTTVEVHREGKTLNFAVSLAKRAIDRFNDQSTKVG